MANFVACIQISRCADCLHFSTFHFCSSHPLAAEDVPFVEPPSRDYFCPVTYEVMDQPHLTLCCGQHLSEETVTKLELCPFCKSKLSAVLNKHFQRQVKSLRVVCRHKGRGCEWQGEFSSLDHHTKSCPNRPPFSHLPTGTAKTV